MRALLCAALLAFAGTAAGQDATPAAPAAPQGAPRAVDRLKDREFGVSTRQFGLQRRVEMYQWLREGGRYAAGWRSEPVDSSGFDQAHANPERFPLPARYWIGQGITLDGKPLDEDVLKALGRWRDFRPGFSALPGNLAATFQPEGDGLSSAENPLDPQIGDLRVSWRELVLPPLQGRVVLEDGVWRLAPEADAATSHATAPSPPSTPARDRRLAWAALALVPLLLLLVAAARARSARRRA